MTIKEKILCVLEEIFEQRELQSMGEVSFHENAKRLVSLEIGECYKILCKLQDDEVIDVNPKNHRGFIDFNDPNWKPRPEKFYGEYSFIVTDKFDAYLNEIEQKVRLDQEIKPSLANVPNSPISYQRFEHLLANSVQQHVEIAENFAQKHLELAENTNRRIDAVANNTYQLKKENEELSITVKEKIVFFVSQIDPQDFQCFTAIIAFGDKAKAARLLKIPDRTLRNRVDIWKTKGTPYPQMLKIVELCKKMSKKEKTSLSESILYGSTASDENPKNNKILLEKFKTDSPSSLLQDILEALKKINSDNCEKIAKELIEIIEEELPQ